MQPRRAFLRILCGSLGLAAVAAAPPPKEELVTIFEQRKVGIVVPEGFALERTAGPAGATSVQISAPKGTLNVQLFFLPDPSGGELAASARARKELMVREFQEYVAASVEQAMQFEELDARSGAGVYCAFTDSTLVGKPQLPPTEFLHVTAGVKAWPGAFVLFKIFSNDLISAEYRALLAMLRDSVQLKPITPLK